MNLKTALPTIFVLNGLIVASAITVFDVEVVLPPSESVPLEQFEEFEEETIFVGNQEKVNI